MKNQVLSIEKMMHLRALGLDTSRASVCLIFKDENGDELGWDDVQNNGKDEPLYETFNEDAEIWESVCGDYFCAETGLYDRSYRDECGVFTLQDIIELLPSPIKYKEVDYFLSVRKNAYGYGVSYHTGGHGSLTLMKCKSIIECAYQMLIWVIKNGYLSK